MATVVAFHVKYKPISIPPAGGRGSCFFAVQPAGLNRTPLN